MSTKIKDISRAKAQRNKKHELFQGLTIVSIFLISIIISM